LRTTWQLYLDTTGQTFYALSMFADRLQLIAFALGCVFMVAFAAALTWWLLLGLPVAVAYRLWYFRRAAR
jgi:hypothetical protein